MFLFASFRSETEYAQHRLNFEKVTGGQSETYLMDLSEKGSEHPMSRGERHTLHPMINASHRLFSWDGKIRNEIRI